MFTCKDHHCWGVSSRLFSDLIFSLPEAEIPLNTLVQQASSKRFFRDGRLDFDACCVISLLRPSPSQQCKWTALIPRLSNLLATQSALPHCLTFTIQAHIHKPTAESTTQGDSRLVRSSEVPCSRTLRHSVRRSRGSNRRPSGHQPTPTPS